MVREKPKVLIVDDEEVICESLFRELSEQGYTCTAVSDGKRALALLAKSKYDAALIDIRLPGISGMDVLRRIQSEHLINVAVMITAVNEVGMAVEAMKLGASDYIVKPFSLARVEAAIRISLEAWNRGKRDCESVCCIQDIEGSQLATGRILKQIDALARGVEIEYDIIMGYSEIVVQKTITIARQLDIPEKQIQRWVALRTMLHQQRNRVVKSSLEKLRQSLPPSTQGASRLQRKTKLWRGIPYDRVYDRAEISGLPECE